MSAVTTLREYWSFDWSKLARVKPNGDALHDGLAEYYPMFDPFYVPVLAVLFYWFLSDPVMLFIRSMLNGADIKDKNGKKIKNGFDQGLSLVTIVHSLALTIYSGWTFMNAFRITTSVYAEFTASGLGGWAAFIKMSCDANEHIWTKHDFGFWVNHFYISKFWEFLDTWIILLKGKKPILLQTYHHAGVVMLMWMFTVTHNTACGMMITFLNSGIHTIMYAYFTLTALEFKFLYKFKPLITSMQLIQFLVGISFTVPTYFTPGCNNDAQFWGTVGIHVYTVILIGLFLDFANKAYVKPKAKAN